MLAFFKKLFSQADVNKDGRVDAKDAKVAVEGVKAKTNQVKTNARVAIKKAAVKAKAVRKPRAT
jgi:hypothetical protein